MSRKKLDLDYKTANNIVDKSTTYFNKFISWVYDLTPCYHRICGYITVTIQPNWKWV